MINKLPKRKENKTNNFIGQTFVLEQREEEEEEISWFLFYFHNFFRLVLRRRARPNPRFIWHSQFDWYKVADTWRGSKIEREKQQIKRKAKNQQEHARPGGKRSEEHTKLKKKKNNVSEKR